MREDKSKVADSVVIIGEESKLVEAIAENTTETPVQFVPSVETPCPCCGSTGPTTVIARASGRRINGEIALTDMNLDQINREIINASSCYCKAKARGAVELMAVSLERMTEAKAAKALLTVDVDKEKAERRAQVAAEKAVATAAAKEIKDAERAAAKLIADAAKAEAKAASDLVKAEALEAAKAKLAAAGVTPANTVVEEDGGL